MKKKPHLRDMQLGVRLPGATIKKLDYYVDGRRYFSRAHLVNHIIETWIAAQITFERTLKK